MFLNPAVDSSRECVVLFADVEVRYRNGLPTLAIPLPSRQERCLFTLRPISNNLGDLIQFLQAEDRGIDRVVAYNDGNHPA